MYPPIKLSFPATKDFWEIPVLFEDADLLAIDKPAGPLTSPDADEPDSPSVVGLMHEGIKRGVAWARSRSLEHLVPTHRLEAGTSGVLLLAKNPAALVSVTNQFGGENRLQSVVVLASGSAAEEEFEVDAPLAPFPNRPGVVRVDFKKGKKARTHFVVIERFLGNTLLRGEPIIHRSHQIRAHLRYLGIPVAGDRPYGGQLILLSRLKPGYRFKSDRPELPLMGRSALHVESLTVTHPVSGAPLTIVSTWPKDFLVSLKFLRRYAPLAVARPEDGARPEVEPGEAGADAEETPSDSSGPA